MSKRDDEHWSSERRFYDAVFSSHKAYRVLPEERVERIAQLKQAIRALNHEYGKPESYMELCEREDADYSYPKRTPVYTAASMLFISQRILQSELYGLEKIVAGDQDTCDQLERFLAQEAQEQYRHDNWEALQAAKQAAKLERQANSIAREAERMQAKENREATKALKLVQKLDNSLFAF